MSWVDQLQTIVPTIAYRNLSTQMLSQHWIYSKYADILSRLLVEDPKWEKWEANVRHLTFPSVGSADWLTARWKGILWCWQMFEKLMLLTSWALGFGLSCNFSLGLMPCLPSARWSRSSRWSRLGRKARRGKADRQWSRIPSRLLTSGHRRHHLTKDPRACRSSNSQILGSGSQYLDFKSWGLLTYHYWSLVLSSCHILKHIQYLWACQRRTKSTKPECRIGFAKVSEDIRHLLPGCILSPLSIFGDATNSPSRRFMFGNLDTAVFTPLKGLPV